MKIYRSFASLRLDRDGERKGRGKRRCSDPERSFMDRTRERLNTERREGMRAVFVRRWSAWSYSSVPFLKWGGREERGKRRAQSATAVSTFFSSTATYPEKEKRKGKFKKGRGLHHQLYRYQSGEERRRPIISLICTTGGKSKEGRKGKRERTRICRWIHLPSLSQISRKRREGWKKCATGRVAYIVLTRRVFKLACDGERGERGRGKGERGEVAPARCSRFRSYHWIHNCMRREKKGGGRGEPFLVSLRHQRRKRRGKKEKKGKREMTCSSLLIYFLPSRCSVPCPQVPRGKRREGGGRRKGKRNLREGSCLCSLPLLLLTSGTTVNGGEKKGRERRLGLIPPPVQSYY